MQQKRSWYANWWAPLLYLLIILTSLFTVRTFYFETFSIPSGSMNPYLKPGEQLVITKHGFGNYRCLGVQILKTEPTKKPKRGDIIVFQYPQSPQIDYVKRVIGLPVDKIIYRNKVIYSKELFLLLKVKVKVLHLSLLIKQK